MSLKNKFLNHLKSTLPGLQNQAGFDDLISDNLLSPYTIELPKSVLQEAQESVALLFGLRQKEKYQKSYEKELSAMRIADPGNKSIVMSYDFHVNADNRLKLIEVNTNASFLALGYEMYRMREMPLPVSDFDMQEVRRNIETEMNLQGKSVDPGFRIAIIDDKPQQQRLYSEFLVYDEYFKSWGWNSTISDISEVNLEKTELIYNRHTDFLLQEPASRLLKAAFDERRICFSPNPYEYFLLADKQRMIDWSHTANLNEWDVSAVERALLSSMVPASMDLNSEFQEDVWAKRKGFFFKPKRAFGSKQSFRGASISRRAFNEIIGHEFIAQQYFPAPELLFETPEGPQNFKYDLRCYAYRDRLQLVVARLYQGQVTNLRTPHGGFACVLFN